MYVNQNEDLANVQHPNFLQENLNSVISMLRINQKSILMLVDNVVDSEDEENYLDVRLNYRDGNLNLYVGDSSFDSNHNGYWSSSSLNAHTICEELAVQLLTDLIEDTYR